MAGSNVGNWNRQICKLKKKTTTEARGESHICTVPNILCEYLQRDSLGVVLLFSLGYSTERWKFGEEKNENWSP